MEYPLQRATSEQTNREAASVPNNDNTLLGPYSKGSAASFKKLSRFFGEDPPRVEDLRSLLESLGYTHLLPVSALEPAARVSGCGVVCYYS